MEILYLKKIIAKMIELENALNPLSANFPKWSNTLKQFVPKLPTNCLSVFDHFVRLTLKGLIFAIFGGLEIPKTKIYLSAKS